MNLSDGNDLISYKFISVGGGVEIVTGGSATVKCRDRSMYMDQYDRDTDIKKLLAVINMKRPITFDGLVTYDDNTNERIINRAVKHNTALIANLKRRLRMTHNEIAKSMISECDITSPIRDAMIDIMNILIKAIKEKRPNMRKIKINGDVGELLDKINSGHEYFKVSADEDDIYPSSIFDVLCVLLDILAKNNIPKGVWTPKNVPPPEWPEIEDSKVKELNDFYKSNRHHNNVYDLVSAIVTRENIICDYLDEVEKYYSKIASDLYEYRDAVNLFLHG